MADFIALLDKFRITETDASYDDRVCDGIFTLRSPIWYLSSLALTV
jgi:hypothetical protein